MEEESAIHRCFKTHAEQSIADYIHEFYTDVRGHLGTYVNCVSPLVALYSSAHFRTIFFGSILFYMQFILKSCDQINIWKTLGYAIVDSYASFISFYITDFLTKVTGNRTSENINCTFKAVKKNVIKFYSIVLNPLWKTEISYFKPLVSITSLLILNLSLAIVSIPLSIIGLVINRNIPYTLSVLSNVYCIIPSIFCVFWGFDGWQLEYLKKMMELTHESYLTHIQR